MLLRERRHTKFNGLGTNHHIAFLVLPRSNISAIKPSLITIHPVDAGCGAMLTSLCEERSQPPLARIINLPPAETGESMPLVAKDCVPFHIQVLRPALAPHLRLSGS